MNSANRYTNGRTNKCSFSQSFPQLGFSGVWIIQLISTEASHSVGIRIPLSIHSSIFMKFVGIEYVWGGLLHWGRGRSNLAIQFKSLKKKAGMEDRTTIHIFKPCVLRNPDLKNQTYPGDFKCVWNTKIHFTTLAGLSFLTCYEYQQFSFYSLAQN